MHHSICESETSFVAPLKPARAIIVSLTKPVNHAELMWICFAVWTVYENWIYLFYIALLQFKWINFIYMYKTVNGILLMWQNHCFSYVAMYLLTLYQHSNGFVHKFAYRSNSGIARIWCRGGMKVRENNLMGTQIYYVIPPHSNCIADVPEYA